MLLSWLKLGSIGSPSGGGPRGTDGAPDRLSEGLSAGCGDRYDDGDGAGQTALFGGTDDMAVSVGPDSSLVLGELTLDLSLREGRGPSGSFTLTAKETALLQYLWERAPEPVSRESILVDVWGYAPTVRTRAIHHAVTRLRKKIEVDPGEPCFLLNVYGHGYRLDVPRSGSTPPSVQAISRPVDPELIGREAALASLDALCDTPLVSLVGPPGVGKSRLGRAVLEQRRSPWRCDLSGCHALGEAEATLAVTLAGGAGRASRDCTSALAALGEATVLLDGCEQLLPALGQALGQWLEAAPRVRFLVTSQAPLGLSGESVLRLDGLATPPIGATAAELESCPAVRLFVARARRQGLVLADVAEVVRALDGNPLAIELAAARTALLAPRQILERLDKRFALLRRSGGTSGPRRDTLWGALSWTWELLEAGAQAALCQLRVFRGPFTLDDAETVVELAPAEDLLEALQALVQLSLVQSDATSTSVQLSLTRTVRAFAEARSDSEDGAEARHARHFAQRGRGSLADLVAATEHALDAGWTDEAARAGVGALRQVAAHGPIDAGLRLAARLLAAVGADSEALRTRRGWLRHLSGDSAGAEDDLRAAITAAQQSGRVALESEARTCLGAALLKTVGVEGARAELEEALRCAESTGDPSCIGPAARELAVLHKTAGALEPALEHYERARAAFHQLGDRGNVARVLGYIGNIHLHAGRGESARQCLESSLRVHRELGATQAEALCLSNLAVLHLRQGRHDEAEPALRAAHQLAVRVGDVRIQSVALTNLGAVQSERGETVAARETYRQARHLQRGAQLTRHLASVTGSLANLESRAGSRQQAEALYAEALALAESLGDTSGVAVVLRNRALHRLVSGYATGASEDLERATQAAELSGEPAARGLTRLMTAWSQALGGESAAAEDSLALGWDDVALADEPIALALAQVVRGIVALLLEREDEAVAALQASGEASDALGLGEQSVVQWARRYLAVLLQRTTVD